MYVKDVNGVLIEPTKAEFPGIPNWWTHETAVRSKGYMPWVGEPEERIGYIAVPSAWHIEHRSVTRQEPRREDPITHEPFMEDIYEEDPITHEMKKVGEKQITKVVDVVFDKSYYQIDEWAYEPEPVPPPVPEPVIRYSKYKIQLACQKRNLWSRLKSAIADNNLQDSWANIIDIASDNHELQEALPILREVFGSNVVDEVLSESIAE